MISGPTKTSIPLEPVLMKHVLLAFVAVMCFLLMIVSCQNRDSAEISRELYEAAMTGDENPDSVRELAALRYDEKTRLLAAIAASDRASFTNREAAVSELAKIGTEEASGYVAHLLAPHNSVILRQQAARSLRNLPCNERCVESILFYLCRRFYEGPSLRETGSLVASLRERNKKDEETLVSDLYSILVQNKPRTISALYLSYGIGTPEPAPFAVDVVQKLRLSESCEMLLRTEQAQQQFKKFGVADPAFTIKAIEKLGCQSNPQGQMQN
jgi:hypothetical protein